MSKLRPNTFQTPNLYTDKYMAFLTSDQWKVVTYAMRRIFGFNREDDRISISQFTDGLESKATGLQLDYGTGLSTSTVQKCLKDLERYGLMVCEASNNSKNEGRRWSLQLESDLVNDEAIMQDYNNRKEANKKRVAKAREALLSDREPSVPQNAMPSVPQNAMPSVPQKDNTTEETQGNPVTPSLPSEEEEPAREEKVPKEVTDKLSRHFCQVRGTEFPIIENARKGQRQRLGTINGKAFRRTWADPLEYIYKKLDRDLDKAESAIGEVVTHMMESKLTFSMPVQIVSTFESFLADNRFRTEPDTPIVKAPEGW